MKKLIYIVMLIIITTIHILQCSPADFLDEYKNLSIMLRGQESDNYNTIELTIDQIEIHPIGGDWKVISDELFKLDIANSNQKKTINYSFNKINLEYQTYSEIRVRVKEIYCEDSEGDYLYVKIPESNVDGYKFQHNIDIDESIYQIELEVNFLPDKSIVVETSKNKINYQYHKLLLMANVIQLYP